MLWRYQERIVFQPPARCARRARLRARGLDYAPPTASSSSLSSSANCRSQRTVVIAFHGNADVARWFIPWGHTSRARDRRLRPPARISRLRRIPGVPTYRHLLSTLARRCSSPATRSASRTPTSFSTVTRSVAAIAAELAARDTPRALVLQSPFSTARAMAPLGVRPGIARLWRLISRIHFDTTARVRALDDAGVGIARRSGRGHAGADGPRSVRRRREQGRAVDRSRCRPQRRSGSRRRGVLVVAWCVDAETPSAGATLGVAAERRSAP